ncbi:MAG: hypothetical protein HY901_07545 [Deltaproteobacteria bacterium]|nr:hypothetical protein [Deltaproteobacteria bacterium]
MSRLALAAATLLLLASCHSLEDQASAWSRFVADFPAASCATAARCGRYQSAQGCAALHHGPTESWPQDTAMRFEDSDEVRRAILKGRASFDEESAKACLAELRRASCESLPTFSCMEAVQGQVDLGAPCYSSRECRPALFCDATAESCPGRCLQRKTEAEASSFPTVWDCATTLVPFEGRCVAYGEVGAPCGVSVAGSALPPSEPDLFCESETASCQPRRGVGGHCQAEGFPADCQLGLRCQDGSCSLLAPLGGVCESQGCARDLRCSTHVAGQEGVCLQRSDAGEPCWVDADCAAGSELFCEGATVSAPGQCMATHGPGETCQAELSQSGGCRTGLFCDAQTRTCSPTCREPFCPEPSCHEPETSPAE